MQSVESAMHNLVDNLIQNTAFLVNIYCYQVPQVVAAMQWEHVSIEEALLMKLYARDQ